VKLLKPPSTTREIAMSVAKVIEITSSSKKSFEDAIASGIARASETIADIQGAWVQDQKVVVNKGKISEYRVSMKVTFVLAGKK
jgi:dodecin